MEPTGLDGAYQGRAQRFVMESLGGALLQDTSTSVVAGSARPVSTVTTRRRATGV